MKKIKVIDLINLIANDEELPILIKFGELYYNYDEVLKDYVHFSEYLNTTLFQYGIQINDLNKEIICYENKPSDVIEMIDEIRKLSTEIIELNKILEEING